MREPRQSRSMTPRTHEAVIDLADFSPPSHGHHPGRERVSFCARPLTMKYDATKPLRPLRQCWLLSCSLFVIAAIAVWIVLISRQTGADSPAETAVASLVGVAIETASDSQWPNLFGPTHDGHVALPNPQSRWNASGPKRVWNTAVGRGYSSPVVSGGHVIVLQRQGDHEVIESLSVADGVRQWEYRYSTHFICQADYSNGPYSTPVVNGEQVFALGAEGELHVLRLADGSLIWHRDLLSEFDAPASMFPVGTSPLLEGNVLIVAIGGSRPNTGIVALDRNNGRTVWTATNDRRGYATPVAATIHGQRHVFVHTDEGLVSLDPANGRVRWRIPFRPKNPDILIATTPVVSDDLVFASAYQLGAMCVRVLPDGDYATLWSDRRSLDSQHNNLICRDGNVIGFSAREHVLGCVSLSTGEWLWKWKSDLDRGCLLSFSNQLLVFSETGRLALLSSGEDGCEYSALSEPLLKPPCFSAPAVYNGKLLLRNEREVACFDLRAAHREITGSAAKQSLNGIGLHSHFAGDVSRSEEYASPSAPRR